MKLKTYKQAVEFLNSHILSTRDVVFPGELGLKRTKYLLLLLDNPQNSMKVVHIAGTSGKGSTAYLLSLLLKKSGKKTGLHISPYILDLRERMQINNTFIPQKKLTEYLSQIIPAIKKCTESRFGAPTYFEILTALTFYVFKNEQVEYAVVETGLGGTYDATNAVTVKNKFVVLTRIGKDHTKILGNTLQKIASQKAGIIHYKNSVITLRQSDRINDVFKKSALKKKANIVFFDPKIYVKNIELQKTGFCFLFLQNTNEWVRVALLLNGLYQIENSSMALFSFFQLAKRDGIVIQKNILKVFESAYFPGRFEKVLKKGKEYILDAAHNPQKMRSFLASLKIAYPKKKFHFVVAFKKGKDIFQMLDLITPFAKTLTVTSFFNDTQDLVHLSADTKMIEGYLRKKQFKNFCVSPSLRHALKNNNQTAKNPIVITGSIYLLGEWYGLN